MKRYRKTLLFLALASVVALAVFAPDPEDAVVRGNSEGTGARPEAVPAARVADKGKGDKADAGPRTALNEIPERDSLGKPKADLFGSRSWQPPPPKVVAPSPESLAPPPPPPPPPQTYRFAGRLVQDGTVQFFVSKGDTPIAVKPGANLDGYVVESITPNVIALVYPPLGHRENIIVPPGIPGDAPAVPVGMGTATVAPQGLAAPIVPPFPPKPPGAAARMQWQGPSQVKVGANFTIALRAMTDQPISGSPLQVRFDPSILESVSVRPGKRFANEAGRVFNHRINPGGMIVVNAVAKSPANDPELLVLTFKPRKEGVLAEVGLASLNLQGADGRPLAHDVLANYRAPVIR